MRQGNVKGSLRILWQRQLVGVLRVVTWVLVSLKDNVFYPRLDRALFAGRIIGQCSSARDCRQRSHLALNPCFIARFAFCVLVVWAVSYWLHGQWALTLGGPPFSEPRGSSRQTTPWAGCVACPCGAGYGIYRPLVPLHSGTCHPSFPGRWAVRSCSLLFASGPLLA